MDPLITILLIIAAVKTVVFGVILYRVFRTDIKEWMAEGRKPKAAPRPVCLFCQSVYLHPVGEPESCWEGDQLTLVSTYECEHCHFPNRYVEHITVGTLPGPKHPSERMP